MINQIINIVREAAEFMKRENLKVEQKGNDSNFVTSADIQVQTYLKEKLTKLLPYSVFIGEEGSDQLKDKEYAWVVDPIDGTSNFIRDMGMSSISVALLKNKEPYIGVIYQPYRDEMFWAEVGKGAYLNGERIHVSDRDFRHSHLCSAMSLYDKDYAKPCFNIIERVYEKADDLRRLGSAATELAYIAAGRAELYFEIRLFPWDIAGAIPIITEAGGCIDIMYEDTMPLDRPVAMLAANNKENLEQLKAIVYEELPELPYSEDKIMDGDEEVKVVKDTDFQSKDDEFFRPISKDIYDEDGSMDLDSCYEQTVAELGLQQSKRDQIIGFYLTVLGFVIPSVVGLDISDSAKAVAFFVMAVIGIIFCHVILRYRIYKEVYWIACRVLMQLHNIKSYGRNKNTIYNLYFNDLVENCDTIVRKWKKGKWKGKRSIWLSFRRQINSAETLLFETLALFSSFVGGIGVYFLWDVSLKWSIVALVAIMAMLVWMNFKYVTRLMKLYTCVDSGNVDDFEATFKKAWMLHCFVDDMLEKEDK